MFENFKQKVYLVTTITSLWIIIDYLHREGFTEEQIKDILGCKINDNKTNKT
jgi:hypothetical protein